MNLRALQQAPLRVLGRREHARRARGGRLPHERGAGSSSCAAASFQGRLVQALAEGIVRFDARTRGPVPPLPGTPR